ncbi:MAG: tetratricopeptide repeat protein [Spirochaetales bacterium]|nr:tetratricopeptide repeat protein [Spirochaetales bacterium]
MINQILKHWHSIHHASVTEPYTSSDPVHREMAVLHQAIRSGFQFLPDVESEFPDLYPILVGWHAYANRDFDLALKQFRQQAEPDHEWQAWALLGLARCHLKLGWWNTAKEWGLYALEIARHTWDEGILFYGYELLGELFLRANQPLLALEIFSRAAAFEDHLKDHSSTLIVSIACALSRLGALSQADYLFQEVYFRDQKSIAAQFALVKGLLSAHLKNDEVAFLNWYSIIEQYKLDLGLHPDLPYLGRIAQYAIRTRSYPDIVFPTTDLQSDTPVNQIVLEKLGLSPSLLPTQEILAPLVVPQFTLNPVDSNLKSSSLPENALEDITNEDNPLLLLTWLPI